MTRSQSEAIAKTIIAAVEPLATRAALKATRADLESSINSLKEQMATKIDLELLKEHMATKKDVESMKVWLLITLLGLVGSILGVVIGSALF